MNYAIDFAPHVAPALLWAFAAIAAIIGPAVFSWYLAAW